MAIAIFGGRSEDAKRRLTRELFERLQHQLRVEPHSAETPSPRRRG